MKLNIYSIFDKAVDAYMRPFFLQADGQANRVFVDMVNDKGHDMNKHPEDYALFRVGVFDDSNASVVPEEPRCLARAHEVLVKE